ncbi:hypothetical protein F1C16_20630 (plasmid) [Hymenobacter sp. NBH84]|uniref:hypothetical protein n=1 Tax=Hymenobacter sp. NBH84 TaxID=2596915 RepID=UPI001627BC37|nr:hypothetical protein [Hymenobacter sp. NBH84]QNE42030.1 hypothetical protein F1C16_20630 [Hymenobacter sp. NBH84]
MSTNLTSETEKTIISLGHAFDGYAYAGKVWNTPEAEIHTVLGQRLMQVQESGRLFLNASDNFATNFYLHRSFHHWGWLPAAKSAEWYTMLFFYLHLYRITVPQAQRHESHTIWANRPIGAAETAAAEIRQILRRG